MCKLGSAPKAPPPPPMPAPPPEPPRPVDDAIIDAYDDEKKAARAAAGRSGSIKTGSDLANEEVNTTQRTLLG